MNKDIKQAMHVEAGKSFGTAETNENERRWNDDKIDRKNQEPTNHYDKTRMKLSSSVGLSGETARSTFAGTVGRVKLEAVQVEQQNPAELLCEIRLWRQP